MCLLLSLLVFWKLRQTSLIAFDISVSRPCIKIVLGPVRNNNTKRIHLSTISEKSRIIRDIGEIEREADSRVSRENGKAGLEGRWSDAIDHDYAINQNRIKTRLR